MAPPARFSSSTQSSSTEANLICTKTGSTLNRETSDLVGPSRKCPIFLTLNNPEAMDCPICFKPLTIHIFQCENGHIACSNCCTGAIFKTKCFICCSPIGSNRCWAIEKVLDSVTVLCRNKKYRCKETISYRKKQDHEEKCQHGPCSCPFPDYNFVGSVSQIHQHCSVKHKHLVV